MVVARIVAILQLATLVQTNAEDEIFDRAAASPPVQHVDLDNTVFGKPGHAVGQTRLKSIPATSAALGMYSPPLRIASNVRADAIPVGRNIHETSRDVSVRAGGLSGPFVRAEWGEDNQKFLEENKGKEGVIVLPSGLQYKVLTAGGGSAHPTANSPCDCHYEGKLINGNKFDSSYDRGAPTTFAPNQVIPGWTEAMQLMVEGDIWEMYIPSSLGYGQAGVGNGLIPGSSTLIFKMEMVKIKGQSVPKK